MIRLLGSLLIGFLIAGCAASGGPTVVLGTRSCDRNGDQEQRIACDR
jgi:hypothetical protein